MEGKLSVGWRFFKAMMLGFHTKLTLPSLLCQKFICDKTLHATLITAKGSWNVEIKHGKRGNLYFEKGWDTFVENHGVRLGEFAIFEYTGGVCFNVSLVDKNGNEKVVSLTSEKDATEAEQNTDSNPNSQEDINCSFKTIKEEPVEFMEFEIDEEMITSHINSCIAPLLQLLDEIDNEDLPLHEEKEPSPPISTMALSPKTQVSLLPFEDVKPVSPIKLPISESEKDRHSIEQEKCDEMAHSSPAATPIEDMESSSKKRKNDEDGELCQAKSLKHDENKSSVKHDKNNKCAKQKLSEDRAPFPVETHNEDIKSGSKKRKMDEDGAPCQEITHKHNENKKCAKQKLSEDRAPFPVETHNEDIKSGSKKRKVDEDGAPCQEITQKHNENKKCAKQKRTKNRAPSHENKRNIKRKGGPKANLSSDCLRFSVRMKPYQVRTRSPYMHIPAEFCLANGLYQNARITLKGPKVEQEVSLRVCKGGKTKYAIITRGWSEFIAGNNLEAGNICIFKLRSNRSSSDGIVLDVKLLRPKPRDTDL